MRDWLEANPGKCDRDWLLEVRCNSDAQREAMRELIQDCDEFGVEYDIAYSIDLRKEFADFCERKYEDLSIEDQAEINKYLFDDDHSTLECDIFFPSKGWMLNIGSEIEDVDNHLYHRWHRDIDPLENIRLCSKGINNVIPDFEKDFESNYHYPAAENKYDKLTRDLYPWNKELESNKDFCSGYVIKMNTMHNFMALLFGDKFEAMQERRRNDYLNRHPELKEKREQMLHSATIECQKSVGLNKPLNKRQIENILQNVDKELYILYPEYKGIIF